MNFINKSSAVFRPAKYFSANGKKNQPGDSISTYFIDEFARTTTKEDASPGNLYEASLILPQRGYSRERYISEVNPTQAQLENFDLAMRGGDHISKRGTGTGSEIALLIGQGEGQEMEGDVPKTIRIAWGPEQGRDASPVKMYKAYDDGYGNPTAGHGVLLTSDLKGLDKNYRRGEKWNRKEAVFLAEDIDRVQQERLEEAKREVEKIMPHSNFLGKFQQAVEVSMYYTMGPSRFKTFKKHIEHTATGDVYNAGLEIIRSDRSETVKGRSLWEALIYLTDGDPRLLGEDELNNLKDEVTKAYEKQREEGLNKTYAQVMEEMYIRKAGDLGYGPGGPLPSYK